MTKHWVVRGCWATIPEPAVPSWNSLPKNVYTRVVPEHFVKLFHQMTDFSKTYAHRYDTNTTAILQHSIDQTPLGMAQPSSCYSCGSMKYIQPFLKAEINAEGRICSGVLLAGHPYNTNCSILKPLDYDQTVASVSE
jgi:hypothetical protein